MAMHRMNRNHSGDTFNGRKQTKKDSDCDYGQSDAQVATNNIRTSVGDDTDDDSSEQEES